MAELLWLLPVDFALGACGTFTDSGIGVAVGAQLGAGLARWVRGVWIIRALVVALAFVGVRPILLWCQGRMTAAPAV